MNELEIELTSFQRVREFADLPSEEPPNHSGRLAPASWPSTGTLEFRDVTARYTPEGPDILKNLSFIIKPGERVAIVGRTGSGKSTLVLSVLRVTHIVSGSIFYDGIDMTSLPLQHLRKSLTIISQETVLFSGDISENLDHANVSDRHDLENALNACSTISAMSNPSLAVEGRSNQSTTSISLSNTVVFGGRNFSHGQRPVLGLARALVRRSKLVMLDEATASMDYETDSRIQSVLRTELEGSTLMTIAHRLRTIIDYDRVIVMGGGEILEMGQPGELFEEKGVFADMVMHGGESTELVKAFESKDI